MPSSLGRAMPQMSPMSSPDGVRVKPETHMEVRKPRWRLENS